MIVGRADSPQNMASARPSEAELADMAQRAQQVVRLIEDLRRLSAPDVVVDHHQPQQHHQNQRSAVSIVHEPMQQDSPPVMEDPRPPKRPWEDISQDSHSEQQHHQQQQQQQQTTFSADVSLFLFRIGGVAHDFV
ncbi:hypothetical protein CPC08DRAFT_186762 [Agrocybe pediades]|nr:hypothetical protein CPC08DRAFT_186762 [Agrocybe pediades]